MRHLHLNRGELDMAQLVISCMLLNITESTLHRQFEPDATTV